MKHHSPNTQRPPGLNKLRSITEMVSRETQQDGSTLFQTDRQEKITLTNAKSVKAHHLVCVSRFPKRCHTLQRPRKAGPHVSTTMKLIQLPRTWVVFRSKEDQARWHVLSDLPPVGVDGFSQRLNKLQLNKLPRFTWNIVPSTARGGSGTFQIANPKAQPPHHVSRETC